MIEDGLFLGLGFCVAAVIAIALLPLVWARAMRVSRTRLVLAMPVSAAEIEAKHDGLRAQAAVAQRRLEQVIEREQQAAARIKVELGHRTVGLAAAEQAVQVLRQERDALVAETTALGRAVRDAEGQRFALEKALHDADWRLDVAVAARVASEAEQEMKRGRAANALLHAESRADDAQNARLAALGDVGADDGAAIAPLKQQLDDLTARLLARDGDPTGNAMGVDADLRQAIATFGDEALRLLRPIVDDVPALGHSDAAPPDGGHP